MRRRGEKKEERGGQYAFFIRLIKIIDMVCYIENHIFHNVHHTVSK
jgi:hypothetical protein